MADKPSAEARALWNKINTIRGIQDTTPRSVEPRILAAIDRFAAAANRRGREEERADREKIVDVLSNVIAEPTLVRAIRDLRALGVEPEVAKILAEALYKMRPQEGA